MSNSSKGKDTERKNVILSAMQKYADMSDRPEKGKEIELKPFDDWFDENAKWWAPDNSPGPLYSSGFHSGAKWGASKAWNARQSPQINIDELTGVIESVLYTEEFWSKYRDLVNNKDDSAAKLIAQAITSHLNGKGK